MIDERVEGEHCGQSTCQGRGRAWARVWVWRARAARCLARPRVPGRGGPAMMLGGPCVRPGHCPRPGNGAGSCSHKKAADQERTAGQALGLFLALARMSCHEATDQGASPPETVSPACRFKSEAAGPTVPAWSSAALSIHLEVPWRAQGTPPENAELAPAPDQPCSAPDRPLALRELLHHASAGGFPKAQARGGWCPPRHPTKDVLNHPSREGAERRRN